MSSSAFYFHRTATVPEVLHVVLCPFMEMVAYTLQYAMNTSCISLPNTPYIAIYYHITYPHCACKFCHMQKNKFYRRRKKCSHYSILFFTSTYDISFYFYSTIFYICSLETMTMTMTTVSTMTTTQTKTTTVMVIIYAITY